MPPDDGLSTRLMPRAADGRTSAGRKNPIELEDEWMKDERSKGGRRIRNWIVHSALSARAKSPSPQVPARQRRGDRLGRYGQVFTE